MNDEMDFQSAFHRGNGCYSDDCTMKTALESHFQSAFHRGNGCYPLPQPVSRHRLELSVRFSSRQWLLRGHNFRGTSTGEFFQSAFHRGNGCYPMMQQ